jgi:hypothetical protein
VLIVTDIAAPDRVAPRKDRRLNLELIGLTGVGIDAGKLQAAAFVPNNTITN